MFSWHETRSKGASQLFVVCGQLPIKIQLFSRFTTHSFASDPPRNQEFSQIVMLEMGGGRERIFLIRNDKGNEQLTP